MARKTYYIGLSASFHDQALAIVNPEGEILFAEASERYLQNKRAFNSPPDDLIRVPRLIEEYCGHDAELVLCYSWSKPTMFQAKVAKGLFEFASGILPIREFSEKLSADITWPLIPLDQMIASLQNVMDQAGRNISANPAISNRVRRRYYDHHLSHAAMACYSSPFEEAACAIVDGYGEKGACDFFRYRNGRIVRVKPSSSLRPETGSLGLFYGMICGLCGFDPLKGEEWKVMGLAPYGKVNEKLRRELRALIQVQGLRLNVSPASYSRQLRQLKKWIRPADRPYMEAADIAHTGQLVYSELMDELLQNFHRMGISDNLAFAGGCALNSSYNGTLLASTPFENLHIPSAPADDGNAIGTALLGFQDENGHKVRDREIFSPFLGSRIPELSLSRLEKYGGLGKMKRMKEGIHKEIAEQLADGKIVARVVGRAEFGPRALGNRSILAHPGFPDMGDRINGSVKFREAFRPFAPAILHACGEEYFENYLPTPYMERTLVFREEVRGKVGAVVHHDFTGRVQSVQQDLHPDLFAILTEFYKITGIPVLLNTSFNVMGKPMVHSLEDALGVFFTSGIDLLAVEDRLIAK